MSIVFKRVVNSILNIPNDIYNTIQLNYKKVSFESKPVILGKIFITGSGKIILGKNVHINSCLSSNPIGGDTRTIFSVDKDAIIKIGNSTGLSNIAISCKKKVIIGNNVKVGGSVKIYDSDFHSLEFEKRKNRATDIPIMKTVELKDDCFIGAHSIILKGVTVGKGSIIGSGSVVTKSVPDGEIWGGNPIKFLRKI